MTMGWAKAIFLTGTLSSAVLFLVLTADTHEQVRVLTNEENLSAQVVAGKRVWHKYNCNDCHTILGFGGYYAADMTRAYWRQGPEGIKAFVTTPERMTTWRKMPQFHVSQQELDDLTAFLQWTSAISNNHWPPQDEKRRPSQAPVSPTVESQPATPAPPAQIQALLTSKGCLGCHMLGGSGGTLGPALDQVGARRDQATIAKIIADPRSVNPAATMPVLPMSDMERQAIAEYLAGLK